MHRLAGMVSDVGAGIDPLGEGARAPAVDDISGLLILERNRALARDMTISLRTLGHPIDCVREVSQAQRLLAQRRYAVAIVNVGATSPDQDLSTDEGRSTVFILVSNDPRRELPAPEACGCDAADVLGVYQYGMQRAVLLDMVRQGIALATARASASSEHAAFEPLRGGVLVISSDARATGRLGKNLKGLVPQVQVRACRTLAEALALPQLPAYSLALVDLALPDARGLDVVRHLVLEAPQLPIVVLARGKSDIEEHALLNGAQEVLTPEASASALTQAVRRAQLRKRAEEKARYLATHDGLTGLLNARSFHERIAQCLARVQRKRTAGAVLYLDLDGFKPINDEHGHSAGDQVLQISASRLLDAIRDGDAAARIGGDEFGLLLEDVYDTRTVRQVAQRVLRALSTPVQLSNGVDVRVTASIGIALCPQAGDTADALVNAADEAMLEAKRAGKSQFCFAHGVDRHLRPPRAQLSSELRDAAHAARFHLVYQPQMHLRTRKIIGVEALLRWNRRGQAPVGPEEFVPLLEEMDLISKVGAFVLNEACRHAQAWISRRNHPLRIAVNVSPLQLEDHDFVPLVMACLKRYNLKPAQLELEVTEGTLMRRGRRAHEALNELRGNGIRIALDDFGTGYASLSYLKDFPVDAIKIDRSFVMPLNTDRTARVLVGAIIDLTRQLGMEVLAEGVENTHQLTYLRERGCDICQGYLFGKPHFSGHIRDLLH